jgi:hypothetical protein
MNRVISALALLVALSWCAAAEAQEYCSSRGPGYGHAGSGGMLGGLSKLGMKTRGDVWAQERASGRPWHGQYYYLPYGQPTALVVRRPPSCSRITPGAYRRIR